MKTTILPEGACRSGCQTKMLDQKFLAIGKSMANLSDIHQIVQNILADMTLEEKSALASLDEDKVPFLRDFGGRG